MGGATPQPERWIYRGVAAAYPSLHRIDRVLRF
jgi:hypothetical protein